MQIPNNNPEVDCAEVNKYLDEEMAPSERTAFELHIADCDNCRIEAELQHEIENIPDEVVLPADFSKVIAATAESQVSGLRKGAELKLTLAIIAALGLIVFLVLGANLRLMISLFAFGVEKIGAFLGLVATFVLNVLLGFVVIVRVTATQVQLSEGLIAVFGIGAAASLAYLMFSGRITRLRDLRR